MEDKTYPKFQYSIFLGGKRDEQLVIRVDTYKELIDAKKEINEIIEKKEAEVKQTTIDSPTAPVCQVHQVPMVWREGISKSTGKPYAFFSCSEKLPNGQFCNYKPDMIKKGPNAYNV